MKRPCLAAFAAFAAFALLALAAQAQDPKKTEAAPDKPAAEQAADKPPPGPGQTPDPQIIEGIVTCLAAGMTPDWKKAWFVIKEIDREESTATRQFQADFFYATKESDLKGKKLRTCGAEHVIDGVKSLNEYLTLDQQRWTSARYTFMRDGRYDAKFDYTPFKPKPKPAAKPAAKKKQETAK